MTVKTGQTWAGLFVTLDATGAASAADSAPTGALYVDGVSNAASVTITGSNPYKFAVTLPTLTAGQRVDMYITATIDTIATAGIVASAQADTVLVSDIVGADSDTLETLSDQLDLTATASALATAQADLDNPAQYKADVSGLALEATLTAIKGAGWTTETLVTLKAYVDEIETRLTATRASYLDKLNVTGTLAHSDAAATYKADVSGLAPANEYDARMTALQADLDNPDQYKADVSTLATSNEYDADFTQVVELLYSIMGGEGWTDETLVSIKALIDAIKTKTDSLTFTTPNKVDASATIDPTGLATSADLAVVDENVDAIKEKTDQMAFTVPNKIDASATVDPTGIATSEELEIIGEKVDDVLDKLNVSTVEFVTAVVGSTITIMRGDTLTASLLNLGSMESYVSLDFTVKASTHQSDDAALIRVRKNASGLTDGLLRLNGAAHTTGTDGSITIDDAPTGDITIMLKATVTDDLVPGTYVYDVQLIEAAEVSTLTSGTLNVSADVTRLVA